MAFNQTLIDDVLKHSDIVKIISSYINVIQKGKEYLAVCPFHDDTSPSLHISETKQIFKCFACGTGGNAITFVQKYEHISFFEALKRVADLSDYHPSELNGLAKQQKVDEKKAQLLKCLKDLTTYYQYALNTPEGKPGLDYLNSRFLNEEMRNKYLLGYAFKDGKATCKFLQEKGHSLKTIEDCGIANIIGGTSSDKNAGRVVFPLCDKDGNVVGFSARRLIDDDSSKYVNTQETYLFHKSSILYNYHIAKEQAKLKNFVYVCEGFMDVLALAKVGIDAAVAIMGTALTQEHIALLRLLKVEIRLCLDGDKPGQTATMKACKLLNDAGLRFRVVDASGSKFKDCDEILNNEGTDSLIKYLNNLNDSLEFSLNYYLNSNPLATVEEKKKLIQEFLPILLSLKSQLELDNFVNKLSKITGFDRDSIKDYIARTRSHQNNQQSDIKVVTKESFHPERKTLRKLAIAEREVLYQMINSKEAVNFYEKNIQCFYDSVYRQIANYIIEYVANNNDVSVSSIILSIEASDASNKEELVNEITTISLEKSHPNVCSKELLDSLLKSILDEKERIFNKDTLEQSLVGKDPLEQARILADYNRKKVLKTIKEEK